MYKIRVGVFDLVWPWCWSRKKKSTTFQVVQYVATLGFLKSKTFGLQTISSSVTLWRRPHQKETIEYSLAIWEKTPQYFSVFIFVNKKTFETETPCISHHDSTLEITAQKSFWCWWVILAESGAGVVREPGAVWAGKRWTDKRGCSRRKLRREKENVIKHRGRWTRVNVELAFGC